MGDEGRRETSEILFVVNFEGGSGETFGHYLTPNSETVVHTEEHFEC